MQISFDARQWRKEARKVRNGVSAISITLLKTGRGEIVVSKRDRLPNERDEPAHGKFIANMLRKRGGDVFEVEPYVERDAQEALRRGVHEIFRVAMLTGQPQHRRMRKMLRDTTNEVTLEILDRMIRGRVKNKGAKYAEKLRAKAERGCPGITTLYGNPPPWGVKSGRFIAGIRSRLGRSKKALRSVYGEV